MSLFEGLVATPVTSFDEDEEIYETGIRNLVAFLHAKGVSNLFCIGSWGGFAMMNANERMRVAEIQISESKAHGMKTIINVSSPSTKEAIWLAKHAQDKGADAIATLAPYYYTHYKHYKQDTVLYYLADLIQSVNIPVHFYNNPRTTEIQLTPKLFKKMLDIGIQGIKDGGGDLSNFMEMMAIIAERKIEFDMIPGSVSMFINGLINGASAIMIGSAMAYSEIAYKAYQAVKAGNLEEAVQLHKTLMKVKRIHGSKGFSPAACYGLLKLRGVDVGLPRRPWRPLAKSELNDIALQLRQVGLDGSS